MKRKLSEQSFASLAEFRYALRKFLRFSKDYLASKDMTPEQYEALLALRAASGSLSIGALSERLQVKHHSAVSLVNKLEGRKLIRRIDAQTDRRVVHLKLSKEGDALIEELAQPHHQRLCELRDEIVRALAALC
jgi:DNA-binding MarR family transcriptional regulator